MRNLIIKSALAFSSTIALAIPLKAQVEAGIHINFSEIKDTFHRHLISYVGDCPGKIWSGIAIDGDLRFISYSVEPRKNLKVHLINRNSGKDITRDYKKTALGSNDFNLTQLGNDDGINQVDYRIYDRKTKETIETGNFNYNITSSSETKQRDATWKLELFCQGDRNDKIKDCDRVGHREVKYCNSRRMSDIRNEGIIDIDRTTTLIDLDR